jgi:type VI protein secretion system component VasK
MARKPVLTANTAMAVAEGFRAAWGCIAAFGAVCYRQCQSKHGRAVAMGTTDNEQASYELKLAETRKFSAEMNMLAQKAIKLQTESLKLQSEARKFDRDPWFLILGAVIAGIATQLPALVHALGVH